MRTPPTVRPADVPSLLTGSRFTLVQGCSGESLLLANAVCSAGDALTPMTIAGIFVPGLNRAGWLANSGCRIQTFFMTPQLQRLGDAVEFLPLCYADILTLLRTRRIDAALFMVAPPDEHGSCSFGPVVDFLADLWPAIPIRIAHINPLMSRTQGDRGIPFGELTAIVEAEATLLGMPVEEIDPIAQAIGRHVAPLVPDGATLQTGLGKAPGAVLRALSGHRNLHIHSGLVGDSVLDLAESGALADGVSIIAGVAIGSPKLYQAIQQPIFEFRPVSHTHSAAIISQIPYFIAVNSALSVDLFGQAYAEATTRGLMSGPGGAIDFARGARAGNGLRIVCLPASTEAGAISRIVAAGKGIGPVSLGRFDIDIVVTEHGAADLRGLGHSQRGSALIKIAAPAHQSALDESWHTYLRSF